MMMLRGAGWCLFAWRLTAILITACLVACGGGEDPNSDVPIVDPAKYVQAAGQDFNVVSAGTAPLYCLGPAGTNYQWIVESNGGLPIGLTNYNTQRTSFVAPDVQTATPIVLICRMTNGSAPVIDSRVTVTLQPAIPPVVVNPANYARAAGQDFSVVSGATAPLYCLGPNGSAYQWVVESNGGLPIELTGPTTQRASFVAPSVAAVTSVVLVCRMTVGTLPVIDSRVTVTIQPSNPPVVVNPADYVRAAGADFSVSGGAIAPFYCLGPNGSDYQWMVEVNGGLAIELSSYNTQRTGFTAPAVTKSTPIVLVCRMTVGTLPVIDSRVTVTIQPSTTPVVVNPADYVHAAGSDFSVSGGAIAPFYCLGPNGSNYQWVVEGNGGLPIELSSYNTQRTSFTAPVVTNSTPIVLVCRMTLDATTVISSRVTATVRPIPVAPTPTVTLVGSISGNRTVLPGQRLALTGNAVWYDDKAAVVSGPLVSYAWSLGAGAPAGTVITPQTGSKDVEVILPANIASAVFFPVVLTVAAGDKTSVSTISVLVDPSGDLTLSITPQAQTVTQGAVVSISTTASNKLFYQWTIVSGTTVTLGGATTNAVGFVAPAPGELRLRVAIGYAPITSGNPGVYFLESVVTVR